MSLYRPAGNANGKISPFWSAQFRGPASRVVSVSTNIRDKRTAKRLEAVWVGAAELGRNGHLTIDRAKQLLDKCAQICRGDSLKQSEGFIDSCRRRDGISIRHPAYRLSNARLKQQVCHESCE